MSARELDELLDSLFASAEGEDDARTEGANGTRLPSWSCGRERSADPNAALLGAQDMIRRTTDSHVRIRADLEEPIWHVRGDPVLLERAVANLVVNAEEAMPEGGDILLSSTNVYLDAERARAAGLPAAGAYVRISVTNNGPGIPDDVRPHIFRSCFTTKGDRGCRGLGLTVVQETAEDAGGSICLEGGSRTTTFALYLPADALDVHFSAV